MCFSHRTRRAFARVLCACCLSLLAQHHAHVLGIVPRQGSPQLGGRKGLNHGTSLLAGQVSPQKSAAHPHLYPHITRNQASPPPRASTGLRGCMRLPLPPFSLITALEHKPAGRPPPVLPTAWKAPQPSLLPHPASWPVTPAPGRCRHLPRNIRPLPFLPLQLLLALATPSIFRRSS